LCVRQQLVNKQLIRICAEISRGYHYDHFRFQECARLNYYQLYTNLIRIAGLQEEYLPPYYHKLGLVISENEDPQLEHKTDNYYLGAIKMRRLVNKRLYEHCKSINEIYQYNKRRADQCAKDSYIEDENGIYENFMRSIQLNQERSTFGHSYLLPKATTTITADKKYYLTKDEIEQQFKNSETKEITSVNALSRRILLFVNAATSVLNLFFESLIKNIQFDVTNGIIIRWILGYIEQEVEIKNYPYALKYKAMERVILWRLYFDNQTKWSIEQEKMSEVLLTKLTEVFNLYLLPFEQSSLTSMPCSSKQLIESIKHRKDFILEEDYLATKLKKLNATPSYYHSYDSINTVNKTIKRILEVSGPMSNICDEMVYQDASFGDVNLLRSMPPPLSHSIQQHLVDTYKNLDWQADLYLLLGTLTIIIIWLFALTIVIKYLIANCFKAKLNDASLPLPPDDLVEANTSSSTM